MDTGVRNCEGDLKAFHPTVMVGVPAVWEAVSQPQKRFPSLVYIMIKTQWRRQDEYIS